MPAYKGKDGMDAPNPDILRSDGYFTEEQAVWAPKTDNSSAFDYNKGEGSMGVERNWGYTRCLYGEANQWTGTMGQVKLRNGSTGGKMKGVGSYVQQERFIG